jgi:glucose-1-phosphate thymidylyltransferase
MIYFPLSIMQHAGVQDVLLITTPRDLPLFEELLGDGQAMGLRLNYAAQTEPRGLADAFIVGHDFVGMDRVVLALGDNLFLGDGMDEYLERAKNQECGATIFTSDVDDPSQYGIVTLNDAGRALSIEEKPQQSESHRAVTGLYFYDNRVLEIASKLAPSSRGELEITDINRMYMEMGELQVIPLGSEITWLDAGTPEKLLEASVIVGRYISKIEIS